MKPIWYFVGLILLAMGAIVIISGIFIIVNPPIQKTVLIQTNPNIWWGSIMMLAGLIFLLKNRKVSIE
jgi:hypothetical protein